MVENELKRNVSRHLGVTIMGQLATNGKDQVKPATTFILDSVSGGDITSGWA